MPDNPMTAAARTAYIVQRRADRATFETIARELNISAQRVHTLFKRALDRIPAQAVDEYRLESLDLLDRVARGLLAIAEGPRIGARTRVEALAAIIRLEDRRAKLLGLDSPRRRELTVLNDDLVDRAIADQEEELRIRAAELRALNIPDDLSELDI